MNLKQPLSYKFLLIFGLLALVLGYVLGGAIGDAIRVIGDVMLIMGAIVWFEKFSKKEKI